MKIPNYSLEQSPGGQIVSIELGEPATGDDAVPARAGGTRDGQALAEFQDALADTPLALEWLRPNQRFGPRARIALHADTQTCLSRWARHDPAQLAYFLAEEVSGRNVEAASAFLTECCAFTCASLSDASGGERQADRRWQRGLALALLETSIPFRYTPPVNRLREHLEALLAAEASK